MVRLRVAVIGQASELALISVPIDTDAATIRAEIIAKAAVKLAVTPPTDTGSVRMLHFPAALPDPSIPPAAAQLVN